MVYGLNDTTPERIARWREAGYRVHLMTGISWGTYQDYLDGGGTVRALGRPQTAGDGSPILHGQSTDIPYMVPTFNFTEYLVQKLRPIIELGVEGIHLEEPEFWARAGYSESFKREWQAFFDEPWQPPTAPPKRISAPGNSSNICSPAASTGSPPCCGTRPSSRAARSASTCRHTAS